MYPVCERPKPSHPREEHTFTYTKQLSRRAPQIFCLAKLGYRNLIIYGVRDAEVTKETLSYGVHTPNPGSATDAHSTP